MVDTVNITQSQSRLRRRLVHRCLPGSGHPGKRRMLAAFGFIASPDTSPLPEWGKAVSVRLIERTQQHPECQNDFAGWL